MGSMSKILLVFGIANILLSSVMLYINTTQSPEGLMCIINIGIGFVMVALAAVYLIYQKKKAAANKEEK